MDCPKLEPLTFSIGDTLTFSRYFHNYLPSAGWVLQYQIRGGAGQASGLPNVEFTSTPDATNTIHQISVSAATTALWAAGEYLLVGYAVNAGTQSRQEIYDNAIILTPNFNTAADNVAVQTFAQQMICAYQKSLVILAASSLLETSVQQTLIIREKRKDIRAELSYWMEFRANEVAQENVNNGRPSGRKIRPIFNIIYPNPAIGGGPSWPFIQ